MKSPLQSEVLPAPFLHRSWSRFLQWAQGLRQREGQLFLVLSLVIGALVGAIVVAFILVTENLGSRMYPHGGAAWRRLVTPVVGALFSGFLLKRFFPDARGSGIPQTKVALFIQGGRIKLRTIFGKFLCSSVSLASGLALGREGPSVQIGAGVASIIGQRLNLPPERLKQLLPVGAAAALAAAFNTPIAAVLFSLEEIMGDLHAPLLGSVVLSAATSWVVLHLFLGDEPLFHVPAYHLTHPGEFAAYAFLGLAGGLVSVAFTKLTLYWRLQCRRLPAWTIWFQPALGGLLVGVLAIFVPDVLGVGYEFVGHVLSGNFVLKTVVLLVVLKLVATAGCYATGNAGGIFGPSLFLGAMLGAAFGGLLHQWIPLYTSTAGAYALVGAGVTFAGIIRTPLTSVFMIFELTRDYSIVVPLMIANLTSFYLSKRLQPKAIYEALAEQDGIHLPSGEVGRKPLRRTVSGLMRPSPPLIDPQTKIRDLSLLIDGGLYFVGEEELLWGIVPVAEVLVLLNSLVLEESSDADDKPIIELVKTDLRNAESLDEQTFQHVHEDHSPATALERMSAHHCTTLPVVDRANVRWLRGIVEFDDLVESYGLPRKSANWPS
jgi:CIC family chloride channel protein